MQPNKMMQISLFIALCLGIWSCQAESPQEADLAVSECQPTYTSSAIINGSLAGDRRFGEVGSLFGVGVNNMLEEGGGLCSATLIAPDVIVTAAHCVAGFPKHRIRISTHPCPRPSDRENLAEVRFVAVHPDWQRRAFPPTTETTAQQGVMEKLSQYCAQDGGHKAAAQYWHCIDQLAPNLFADAGFIDAQTGDLAIAILDKTLQLAPLARLPTLSEEEEYVNLGAKLTAVGYGVSGRNEHTNQVHLGDRYAGRVRIDELGLEEMRLDFTASRICSGDSGGPLLQVTRASSILLGVGVRVYPSHRMHATLCNGPGVATRVGHYTPWIRETLTQACAAGQRSHQMCISYPI